ncbi:hypothetical protein JL722_10039 [Aureococcus anophagefferens]|nr:hypothetical protein JL722_10039 [Aureococcus anophagefferens]
MASTTDSRADDEDQVRVADGDDYGFFTDTSDSDGDDARSYLSHDASTADLSRNSSSTDVASLAPNGLSLLNALVIDGVKATLERSPSAEVFDLPVAGERPGAPALFQRWHVAAAARPRRAVGVPPGGRRAGAGAASRVAVTLTPGSCPPVFSREFAGGVVVGCSVAACASSAAASAPASTRSTSLVSRGGDCHVRWVRHTDLAAHHDATAAGAAYARARCAWLDGERRRRSRRSVGDFAYLAARRRAYLAWLQELLFAAPAPGAVERLAFPTELALRRGVESHTALDPPKRDEGRASPLAAYVA